MRENSKPKVGDIWSNQFFVPDKGDIRYYYLLVEDIKRGSGMFNALKLDTAEYGIHHVGYYAGTYWRLEA